jgi:hypothetical protein
MILKLSLVFCVSTLMTANVFSQKYSVKTNTNVISLSAIKGTTSKVDTVELSSEKKFKIAGIKITGTQAPYFEVLSVNPPRTPTTSAKVVFIFQPPANFVGVAQATVQFQGTDLKIEINGLSTQGLEGENEAPLEEILQALGMKINIGWSTLANHLRPELQGDELNPSLFTKAGHGEVEMIPVARYSPDFLLNFGYYVNNQRGPQQSQVGILAKAADIPEHQTLYPALANGKTSFDPGDKTFGFYAISPQHSLYSEDLWNMLYYPTHAAHAVRIFPVKDSNGKSVPNSYLVCMEEAANGDYNDYVFLVKNVKPVDLSREFASLFNGKDLAGWSIWLEGKEKNSDPNKIFTIDNEIIHDMGSDLGYILSDKSFGNYHFVVDFKWGEKRWPPRENAKRDSGICYNIPEGEEGVIWPRSVECQIQEGDVGDFWLIGYSTVQVNGKQNPPLPYSRLEKKKDAEKPTGEWNTVEVISFNGKCVHIVNGVVVNYGENSNLIGGKILLQSEYAEIYYRDIKIREL